MTKNKPNNMSRSEFLKQCKLIHPDLHPEDPNATSKFQKFMNDYNSSSISETKKVLQYKIYETTIPLSEAITGTERYITKKDKTHIRLKIVPLPYEFSILTYKKLGIQLRAKISLPDDFRIENGDRLIKTICISRFRFYFLRKVEITSADGLILILTIPKKITGLKKFWLEGEGLCNKSGKRNPLYIDFKVASLINLTDILDLF